MATYKTILTNKGLSLITDAEIAGVPVALARIAIGDGNGNAVTPSPSQTTLVREVYRNAIGDITPNPDVPGQFSAEVNIPSDIGGFTIREAGIYTEDGDLFAVCNTPATYKATAAEGAFGDGTVKMVFQLSNAATVNLSVDTSIIGATRQWVINYAIPANIIPGGLTNQILAKNSNADGDVLWKDATEGVIVLVDTVEERQTLALGQTACILAAVTTHGLAVYVDGIRLRGDEWTVVDATHLTLATSYNAGTPITFVQNEQTGYNNVLRPENNLSDVDGTGESFANLGGQSGEHTYAVDISPTANAVRATYSPAFGTLTDGMVLRVKAANANTGASTFAPNGMAAAPIIGSGYAALAGGEIVPGGMLTLVWSTSLGSWVMSSSGGSQQVAPAVAPVHAMQLGQATGRLLGVKKFLTSGIYHADPRATSVIVETVGAGGGTQGHPATSASQSAVSSGGAGGAHTVKMYTSGFDNAVVAVGSGGSAGAAGAGAGAGGDSSFNGEVLSHGGNPGNVELFATGTGTVICFGRAGGGTAGDAADLVFQSLGGRGGSGYFTGGYQQGGDGGSSGRGGSGGLGRGNVAGGAATSASVGGGAGGIVSLPSNAAKNGSQGAIGQVLIWEYS